MTKLSRKALNELGVPYLNSNDPLEVAAFQAHRVGQDKHASFAAIQLATSSVAAWTALVMTQSQAHRDDVPESHRVALRNLDTAIVYEIAVAAAGASFRAGVAHGLDLIASQQTKTNWCSSDPGAKKRKQPPSSSVGQVAGDAVSA